MDFADVVGSRRMVRNFTDEPVDEAVLRTLLDRARRAPSAGNTAATHFVVLSGRSQTQAYWDLTLPEAKRPSFPWPGLLDAPVLIIPFCEPQAYLERYLEPDKVASGLGADVDRWAVPYWFIDTGFAAMSLLLGVVDAGLGACFFGLFDHGPAVAAKLGVPAGYVPIGTVAVGHPAPDRRSKSSKRPRPDLDDVVHWGGW